MSIFEKKKQVTRKELRQNLRKGPAHLPGSGRRYFERERVGMEKDFGKKYGTHISKQEFKDKLYNLERERHKMPRSSSKWHELDHKIKYFKKLGGI